MTTIPELDEAVREYLSSIGKKGGSSKSERKRLAVIENGKKGGRPRGRTVPDTRISQEEAIERLLADSDTTITQEEVRAILDGMPIEE